MALPKRKNKVDDFIEEAIASKADQGQGMTSPKKKKAKAKTPKAYQPRSFLLGDQDRERLKNIAAELSTLAGKKVSEAAVIKGLLLKGEKMKADSLLQAVREATF